MKFCSVTAIMKDLYSTKRVTINDYDRADTNESFSALRVEPRKIRSTRPESVYNSFA